METKRCTKCQAEKPLEDFPIHKNRADGRNSWCRACVSNGIRDFYNRNPRLKGTAPSVKKWRMENREKRNAHRLAERHPEALTITYECPCDAEKQKHHFDYERPLEVMLLCRKCHGAEHRRLRSLTTAQAFNE